MKIDREKELQSQIEELRSEVERLRDLLLLSMGTLDLIDVAMGLHVKKFDKINGL